MHKKEASQVNYAVITENVWGVGDDAKAIKQTFFSQKHTQRETGQLHWGGIN